MNATKKLDKLGDQVTKREQRDKALLGKRPSFEEVMKSERAALAKRNGKAVEQKETKATKGSNGHAANGSGLFQELTQGLWAKLEKVWGQGTSAGVSSDDIGFLGELLRKRAHKRPLANGEAQRAVGILHPAGHPAEIEQKETKPTKGSKGKAVPENVPVSIELNTIHRHPKNRQPDKAAVKRLAASIDEHELQQPILLRKPPSGSLYPLASGHLQIVFGERRFAAHELLGRKTIRAFVREDLDDVQTLVLMAEENAKRENPNPVERARHIETLTAPIEDGGGGMMVKDAAVHVGFHDAASASNALRLLKLPAKWLDRVAAGELPETFARLLVPICHAPKLMDLADSIWQAYARDKDWKPAKGLHYGNFGSGFDTRREVESLVNYLLREATRPMDGTHQYNSYELGIPYDRYPKLFEADEATLKQLDVQEFTIGKETERLATNWKLYDELQLPAIKKHLEQKKTKAAAKKGKDKAAKKELTPAEQKKRDAEADEQLAKHVAAWRHDWLRGLVADCVETDGPLRERLMLLFAADCLDGVYADDMDEAISAAVAKYQPLSSKMPTRSSAHVYDAIAATDRSTQALTAAAVAVCRCKLTAKDHDWEYPAIVRETIDELAAFAGVDLKAAWGQLQQPSVPKEPLIDRLGRLEELFQLHNSRQLDVLGKELGVHVADARSKDAKVNLLMSRDRLLKLPKCIAPLPAKATTKNTKATKRGQR